MKGLTDKTNCTNPQWFGRSHCEKCHIRHLMLYSELPEIAFENSLDPINHYIYPIGSTVYETGSDKKYIYSIRRGMLKLEYVEPGGDCRIVRLLGPGTVAGIELINGATEYHHNAIAVSELDICKIPISSIKKLEKDYPKFCNKIRDQIQFQLNLADKWIYALSTGSAKQRVAQLILLLNELFADEQGNFVLLHRDDMSAMINITTETVSRIIAKFKRKKILIKSSDKHFSCDVKSLQEIAHGE